MKFEKSAIAIEVGNAEIAPRYKIGTVMQPCVSTPWYLAAQNCSVFDRRRADAGVFVKVHCTAHVLLFFLTRKSVLWRADALAVAVNLWNRIKNLVFFLYNDLIFVFIFKVIIDTIL